MVNLPPYPWGELSEFDLIAPLPYWDMFFLWFVIFNDRFNFFNFSHKTDRDAAALKGPG